MNTGEDQQALRKIMDMTRLISIIILAIHFYISLYQVFAVWHYTAPLTDRISAIGVLPALRRSAASTPVA